MKPKSSWVVSLLAFGFILGGGVSAIAQTVTDQNGRRETIPPQSTDQSPARPEQSVPGQVSATPNGVIAPPKTGDANVIQPPSAGPDATPVIKPPGTPGGNTDIQPK